MIDDQLPFDARVLIAAGRERLGPDAATIARLRARVDAAVIGAAPAPAAGTSLALKLALAAALGGGAYVARDLATRAPFTMPSIELEVRGADDLAVEATGSLVVREEAVAAPAIEARPSVVPRPAVVATPPNVEPVRVSLAREIELVDRATASLRTGDLDEALATLHTYTLETAEHGQLGQDAAALRIEVLCRKHDANASVELATFTERWPRSPQRVHLTTVCSEVMK